ncbi:MAG: SDR family oxidoreductase [Blastocatellia bacterium]
MSEWKNKTVLITGASYGIGVAFCERLAAAGASLILTARSEDRLQTLAAQLRAQYGCAVQVIGADLAAPTGARDIFAATTRQNLTVDLLINNAGFGALGEFTSLTLSRQLEMIQVNVSSLVELTHLYLQTMKARQAGAILNVASTASFQAVPYFAVYAATKAFVLSFSEALAEECLPYNVRVMALCPGSTATNFQEVAGSQRINTPRFPQTAEQVADAGLAALSQGRAATISGTMNKVQTQLQRALPRRVITKLAGKMFKPAG